MIAALMFNLHMALLIFVGLVAISVIVRPGRES